MRDTGIKSKDTWGADDTYYGWRNQQTWHFILCFSNEGLYTITKDGLRDMNHRHTRLKWIESVACTIIDNNELCPDLDSSDLGDIYYPEVLEYFEEDMEVQ